MSLTSIEWTDRTWNPVTGCTKVSPGCDHCYAETIATRFAGSAAFPHGFDVQVRKAKVNDPLAWRKPSRVFVNSMSDLFHADVPTPWLADIFAVMAAARKHTFQVLTKRHGRMRSLLHDEAFIAQVSTRAIAKGLPAADWQWPIPNVHLGVSVEDQKHAELRIPALLETPAAVRFVSAEPLLGPVDLRNLKARNGALIDCLSGDVKAPEGWVYTSTPSTIRWVIVGGESGRGARAMHPEWARSLRDQVATSRASFLFKQWGEWGPAEFSVRVCDPQVGWLGTAEELAVAKREAEAVGATHVHTGNWWVKDGETVWELHEVSSKPWSLERGPSPEGMEPMRRWGKKVAGRLLDGRTWDEFPGGAE